MTSGVYKRAKGTKTNKQRYTVAQVEAALRATAGVYSLAGEKLNCSRATIGNYVNRYPELKSALDQILDETIDFTESQLLMQIKNGNMTAIIFYLKTKGKHRGYIEEHRLAGSDGGAVEFKATDARKQVESGIASIADAFAAAENTGKTH